MSETSPPKLSTGDRVEVTYGRQTVRGSVALASPNAKSLVLIFEAMLGRYVGMMPVLWNDDRSHYEDLITQQPVSVVAKTGQ